jgi:hypothetical protein
MLLTLKNCPSGNNRTSFHVNWIRLERCSNLIVSGCKNPSAIGWEERHMIREILLSSTFFIALTAPAMAQDPCVVPTAPTIPDGARATPAQIISAQNDIKAFATASDNYQACLAAEIARQKDLAKQTNVEFDPKIQAAIEVKAGAQRKDVERLAAAWGASVTAFNAAQQRKPVTPAPRSPAPSMGSAYGGGNRY